MKTEDGINLDSTNSEEREFKMAELYVQAARTTTKRCYWAYSALLLVCITAGLTFYNEYFSYTEKIIKTSGIALSDPVKNKYISLLSRSDVYTPEDVSFYENKNLIFETLWEELVKEWVETQFISIPLLGIKLSTSDVMALMSFLFIIIMAWCYYCIRSENFAVGKVLISTQYSKHLDVKRYVFYGICFNNIFFPTTTRDIPYRRLKYTKNVSDEIIGRQEKINHNNKWIVKFKKYIPKILFLLPVIILSIDIVMHACDLYMLDSTDNNCFKELVENPNNQDAIDKAKAVVLKNKIVIEGSSIHYNNDKIFRIGFPHGITNMMKKGSTSMIWYSLILTSISLILVIIMMHRIFKYLNGTNKTLLEYRNMIKCDESKTKLKSIFRCVDALNAETDDKGKKIVSEILPIDSRTRDHTMFDVNLYFGLTAYTPQELCNLLDWAIINLDGAKIADERDSVGKIVAGMNITKGIEYYLLFRAGSNVNTQLPHP